MMKILKLLIKIVKELNKEIAIMMMEWMDNKVLSLQIMVIKDNSVYENEIWLV